MSKPALPTSLDLAMANAEIVSYHAAPGAESASGKGVRSCACGNAGDGAVAGQAAGQVIGLELGSSVGAPACEQAEVVRAGAASFEGAHAEGSHEDPSRVRQRAVTLLEMLDRARVESRQHLTTFKRADAMEAVLGRSAIDMAIEKTRQSLRSLDEALLRRNAASPRHPGASA
jgi:hypothetical protein